VENSYSVTFITDMAAASNYLTALSAIGDRFDFYRTPARFVFEGQSSWQSTATGYRSYQAVFS
jgi:hypothetical protein